MKYPIGYKELKSYLEKSFDEAGISEKSDIDWIIVEVTGKKRSMLPFIDLFSTEELDKIMSAIQNRLKHIPLGYIFGHTNFYGYDLQVDSNVLIPRIDTEVLVETVINEIKTRNKKVSALDVGTGSGAIAIAVQKETGCEMFAVDISQKALEIAEINARKNNAEIKFIESDLFENIDSLKVDFIISNPPYIETSTIACLDKEVKDNEPILALDGGADGLDFYKQIVNQSIKHLNNQGMLAFEIGYNQGESVKQLMEGKFKNIKIIKDYNENNRVVIGEKL